MNTRVIAIDPNKLVLLAQNARFMRHEVFMRLVDNLKRDRTLTQLPFCALLGVYEAGDEPQHWDDGTPKYEVLSGNHRIKAAIAAGLDEVQVQITDDPLSPDRRRAIQLSHNAIAGEDDPAILKTIYDGIEDLEMRAYTGLDDQMLELMADVSSDKLSEASLAFQRVNMVFLPEELEQMEAAWDAAQDEIAGSSAVWLASWKQYDDFLDALEAANMSYRIRNVATSLMIVLEIFSRHIQDLREGWLSEGGERKEGRGLVPIETVLGTKMLSADAGARLHRLCLQLSSQQILDNANRIAVLDFLMDQYEHHNG